MFRLSTRWLAATLATATVLHDLAGPTMVRGYIPATPSNDTALIKDDGSTVFVRRPANSGTFTQQLWYLQAGSGSHGLQTGALVQYSEDGWRNVSTTTPWIALVSCDQNSTNSRADTDILALARDNGAVGMILYSAISETCVLNDAFWQFDRILDLYATTRLSAGKLIHSQLQAVDITYTTFNSSLLDSNINAVQSSSSTLDSPNTSPYLVATLRAWNSTAPGLPDTGASSDNGGKSGGGPPTTGPAMTMLYAITGSISLLLLGAVV